MPGYTDGTGPWYVYRAWNSRGRLLYVGFSENVERRMLTGHRYAAPWYREIADISAARYRSRAAAFAAEDEAIRTEWPIWNKDRAPDPSAYLQYEADRLRRLDKAIMASMASKAPRRQLYGAAKQAHEQREWRIVCEEGRFDRLVSDHAWQAMIHAPDMTDCVEITRKI